MKTKIRTKRWSWAFGVILLLDRSNGEGIWAIFDGHAVSIAGSSAESRQNQNSRKNQYSFHRSDLDCTLHSMFAYPTETIVASPKIFSVTDLFLQPTSILRLL